MIDEADAAAPVLLQSRPAPGVLVLTLNRAQQRNALSLALLDALENAIAIAGIDGETRAIVIAASGSAFSSGHDLKEIEAHRADHDGGHGFFQRTFAACARTMQSIMDCPRPVIAAVQGTATAAGCQLVATCDLAVAAEGAQFCTPGVNIGLFCSTPGVALARNVPRKRALEMLLLGDMLPASAAEQYGLVNRIVAADRVLPEALSFAARIASKSPLTLKVGKRAFYEQIDMPIADAYDHATRVMVENMMDADAREGICAFLEKREAIWQG